MKITKQALIQDIQRSRFINAFRFTSDEDKKEQEEQLKRIKKQVDKLIRQQKDITITIIEK